MEVKLKDIIRYINGDISDIESYENIFITDVSTDSRTVKPGEIFFALKGEVFDGHKFVEKAIENGATALVVSEDINIENEIIIKVKDTSRALMDFAEEYLKLFNLPLVAITGSTGKTTTKDMTAAVLSEKFKVHKNEGNLNNEIGLPLTVFKLSKESEIVVLEMGMNIKGEIENLTRIAKPDIALITNIGVTHIENFENGVEGILNAKCEIFSSMEDDAVVILNNDDKHLKSLKDKFKNTLYFGTNDSSDVFVTDIKSLSIDGIEFKLNIIDKSVDIKLDYPGEHMAINAASAASVGLSLGMNLDEIKKGLEKFVPSNMRMNIKKLKNNIILIDDSYNSSPTSMKSSISVLDKANGRKVAILGEMKELGSIRDSCHKEAGKDIAKSSIDLIICLGEGTKAMYEELILSPKEIYFFDKQEDLYEHLDILIKDGDTVLVKGSRSLGLENTSQKILEVKA